MSAPVQLVIDRLHSLGAVVRRVPDGFMAQCPSHDDRNPSLHISEGADGRALLRCMAGCGFDDVCRALDIESGATFADNGHRVVSSIPLRDVRAVTRREPVCEYVYTDEHGAPVVKVVRHAQVDAHGTVVGKTFRQYRRVGDGWTPGLAGMVPPLYRLPEVLAAVRAGRPVLIVEGEKDADRAASLGYVATTCAMGAGKWRPEHTAALTGAETVIVADNDAPGRQHARSVYADLDRVAVSRLLVVPAEGAKDLSEHLDQGHDMTALRPLPADAPDPAELAPAPGESLAAYVVTTEGLDEIPEPTYLVHPVLQLDSLAWLQGRPGHGKSFVALDLAGSVATGITWQGFTVVPGVVLYVIAEGLHGIRPRVRAWEAASGHPMTGAYFLPLAVNATTPAWRELCALAQSLGAQLVILDTQARMTTGMEENSARDMGLYVECLEVLRAATGATVLSVHHEGRTGETMRGSTAMDGAATTILRVAKDDELIKVQCVKQKEAPPLDELTLRLIPTGASAVLATVAPGETPDALGAIRANTRRWLRAWWERFRSDPVSVSQLVRTMTVSESTFHDARFALAKAGVIDARGDGRNRRYRLLIDPSLTMAPDGSERLPESPGRLAPGGSETPLLRRGDAPGANSESQAGQT